MRVGKILSVTEEKYEIQEITIAGDLSQIYTDVQALPDATSTAKVDDYVIFSTDKEGKRYLVPTTSSMSFISDTGDGTGKVADIDENGTVTPSGEDKTNAFAEPSSFFHGGIISRKAGRIYPGKNHGDYLVSHLPGHGDGAWNLTDNAVLYNNYKMKATGSVDAAGKVLTFEFTSTAPACACSDSITVSFHNLAGTLGYPEYDPALVPLMDNYYYSRCWWAWEVAGGDEYSENGADDAVVFRYMNNQKFHYQYGPGASEFFEPSSRFTGYFLFSVMYFPDYFLWIMPEKWFSITGELNGIYWPAYYWLEFFMEDPRNFDAHGNWTGQYLLNVWANTYGVNCYATVSGVSTCPPNQGL